MFLLKGPDSACDPYRYDNNNKPIVPCGALANSMFNGMFDFGAILIVRRVLTASALPAFYFLLRFKDTFKLHRLVGGKKTEVPLDGKGVAWWTDYNVKNRNPSGIPLKNAFNGTILLLLTEMGVYSLILALNKDLFSGTVKPINWPKPVYELDTTDEYNNGFINQDFLVWMRRAALPDFRKLYRRITDDEYLDGLPAGNYSLDISYSILS